MISEFVDGFATIVVCPIRFPLFAAPDRVPPRLIECPVFRRLQQPRGRILRHAGERPGLHGFHQSILHDILGEVQMLHAEMPRQDRDEPARLAPEQVVNEPEDGGRVRRDRHG